MANVGEGHDGFIEICRSHKSHRKCSWLPWPQPDPPQRDRSPTWTEGAPVPGKKAAAKKSPPFFDEFMVIHMNQLKKMLDVNDILYI